MDHYEEIHREQAAGFEIRFSVTPECMEPDWDFASDDDKADTLRRIENGTLAYFVARVEAYKAGVLLTDAYLGGCCYDSPMQFVEARDYYADMVERVVEEARSKIEELTA